VKAWSYISQGSLILFSTFQTILLTIPTSTPLVNDIDFGLVAISTILRFPVPADNEVVDMWTTRILCWGLGNSVEIFTSLPQHVFQNSNHGFRPRLEAPVRSMRLEQLLILFLRLQYYALQFLLMPLSQRIFKLGPWIFLVTELTLL
jgi:hypothetical protein